VAERLQLLCTFHMRRILVVLALCWTVTNLLAGAVALARLLDPSNSLETVLGDRDDVVMALAAPVLLLAAANLATMGVTSTSLRSRVWGAMFLSGISLAFVIVVLVTPTTREWLSFQEGPRAMNWLTLVNVLFAGSVAYLGFVVFTAERKLLRMLYGKDEVEIGYTLQTTTEVTEAGEAEQAARAAEEARAWQAIAEPEPVAAVEPDQVIDIRDPTVAPGRRLVDGRWTDDGPPAA
jgi:hypothetical protein